MNFYLWNELDHFAYVCTGMGDFNSDDHFIHYCGHESFRRNGVASWSTKESEIQFLGAISKKTE